MRWLLAARPKTLPAAVVPVAVGGAMAGSADAFSFNPWIICLIFGLLIQTGTNFANDYYDYIKGADDDRRIGPSRAVASGWISPRGMKQAMLWTFASAFGTGCLLVPYGGWWLILIGVLSITCGIAYTGGPYPLGYNGWGDVFVFVFFGWIATAITFYVQTGTFVFHTGMIDGIGGTLLAGSVPGALATNLLVVNNVRDAPLDREAGKKTLVARFGRKFGILEYAVMSVVSVGIPLYFATAGRRPGCFMVLLCAPLFLHTAYRLIQAHDRASYNKLLGRTALLLILTGLAFTIGLLV